jgi:hypothetical protein
MRPMETQTKGKPWTKLVVPSEVWRECQNEPDPVIECGLDEDVPMGSTQNVGVSVRGSRLPAAYDSSPILSYQ